ncbi:Fibrinogen C domain-containing protein 1 [Holothuria leucospilota]|uniref:Fibrinogen C domain-containing protein 1 n=1 Tax=Holothuria leucospilota TaxID=206669 RepID=A0A9Q1H4Z3_HOLLE|nr:Fibrinogen C domain-containing protein 1 [Holothuria leucospilota]
MGRKACFRLMLYCSGKGAPCSEVSVTLIRESFISQRPASTPSAPSIPTDCYDVFTSGSPDGVYTIQPTGWTGSPFEVYCNMSHGGGWTVSVILSFIQLA